jgi:UDP-glucose 4-epimerase
MTVLVTGGAGYIGSHCVLALLGKREDVVVLDNLSTGSRDAVPPAASLVAGDVGDYALVSDLIKNEGITTIIHLAASTVVPESVERPLFYYLNNTANSRTLIQAAAEGGVQEFVFSSTAAVYGGTGDEPVTEDDPVAPISPYGMSKLMAERILTDAAVAGGPRYIILRYFNVAGADPLVRAGQSTPRATHLIKVACQAVFAPGCSMRVFGTDYPTRDGTCIRDYIHVSDLAEAHIAALSYLKSGGKPDIFNCGYGRGSTVLEVIRAVEQAAGVKLNLKREGRRAGDAASTIASNRKIRETLGWTPQFDELSTIVNHALAWEKSGARSGHQCAGY